MVLKYRTLFTRNIVVNGRAMFYEGDIKPVVKRVRPYKTLLINLPPKSFGFWVLANTNVEACQELDTTDEQRSIDTISITDEVISRKRKRSINFLDIIGNNEILNTANKVSNDIFNTINNQVTKHLQNPVVLKRVRRQTQDEDVGQVKRKLRKLKSRADRKVNDLESKSKSLFGNLRQLSRRNVTKNKNDRHRKSRNNINNKDSKRNFNKFKQDAKVRDRRSIMHDKSIEEYHDVSAKNEINVESKENMRLWKILRKINKELQNLSDEKVKNIDRTMDNDNFEGIKEVTDDSTSADISELSQD